MFAIGPRAIHADDRAHRADQAERHGNTERIAGRDPVAHSLQEVAHLVREQYREHCAHVREAQLPMGSEDCAAPSSVSTDLGRQLVAPTQNVDRHVAMNSMIGKVIRRRGWRSQM